MSELIDTHAHLDLLGDIDSAIQLAKQSGISSIVAVGEGLDSNKRILQLAEIYPAYVYPAIGLHPCELGDLTPQQIDEAIDFIKNHLAEIVAVGEIGLDYDKRWLQKADKELQYKVLRRLLEIAAAHNKTVSMHTRYSWKDGLALLKEYGIKKAVFHWYTGSVNTLNEIIKCGYFISATPASEYHQDHRRAIMETPLTHLLLETDCPVSYGREIRYSSQPADVRRSLKAVADLKNFSENEVADQTSLNAKMLFGI